MILKQPVAKKEYQKLLSSEAIENLPSERKSISFGTSGTYPAESVALILRNRWHLSCGIFGILFMEWW